MSLEPSNTPPKAAARKAIDRLHPEFIQTLSSLVRIPGIAWEAFDQSNLDASAKAVAELLQATGVFEWVDIRRAPKPDGKPGAPAVLAKRSARNGKPTVLLYAHHDVQPPGDPAQWNSDAFEPVIRDGRMFGRGAADDKAGIVAHLASIKAASELLGEDFELGVKVFIEGEEEAGSPSFRAFLEANAGDLEADVIVVADSGNWTTEIPAITSTLRGLVSQEVTVSTLDHALHSGMYGGVVPDAMLAMIQMLASLHKPDGSVAIRGLVSSEAANLPYDEHQARLDSGILDGVDLIGSGSILSRNWTQPAITVIGIDGQSVALSSNTLLPSVKAKVSMRIAPGESPEQALALLREHLAQNVPFGAKLHFGDIEMGKPYRVDESGWASSKMKQALSDAFGKDCVNIGIGGSIPFISDLVEVFPKAQILVTGVEDPDSRAHSPNESVDLEMLKSVMLAETLFLLETNGISKSE